MIQRLWSSLRHNPTAVLLTVANVVGAGASFVMTWGLARILIPRTFASAQLALNDYAIFIMICLLGIGDGGFKYAIEVASPEERIKRLQRALGTSVVGSLAISLLLAAIVALGLLSTNPEINQLLLFMCFAIPFANFGTVSQAAFRALNKLPLLAFHQILIRSTMTILILGGAWTAGAYGFGWMFVASQFVVFALSFYFLPRELRSGWRFSFAVLPHSFVAFIWALLVTTNMRLDLLMIERLIGPSELTGAYSIASLFALSFFSLGWSIQSRLSAVISQTFGNLDQMKKSLGALQLRISGFVLLWTFAVIVFFELLFPFVFGGRYASARSFVWPLLLYTNLALGSAVAYYALFILGRGSYNVGIWLAALLLNAALTYMFIHQSGLNFVAYGKVIAEVFILLMSVKFYRMRAQK